MFWKKSTVLWLVSFVLMALVAVYQRMSGPTYPIKGEVSLAQKQVSYKLLRSENCETNAQINLAAPQDIVASIEYKRYKSYDSLSVSEFERFGDTLRFNIPHQPAAGKIQYQVFVKDTIANIQKSLTIEPILIRYKGTVPILILIIHIFFMFGAMLLAARTALAAFVKSDSVYRLSIWTIGFLFVGGLILGPIVQQYAFGALWTGWPFGHDMTDNKTLIALIVWVIALLRIKKNPKDVKWAIIAFVVMMVVYLIPHSVLGSELDYTKELVK